MTDSAFVELFRSPDILVRFARRGASLCVVTFESFTDVPDLEREAFGEEFLGSRDISAVHVLNRVNRWYQEPELDAALARIRAVLDGFPRVVSYGSSMGAYAVLRFAPQLRTDLAIALSPQYTMARAQVPFETRWQTAARAISWRPHLLAPLASGYKAVVIYDPRHPLDRRHAALIERDMDVSFVRLPFAGHPAGTYLAESGVLVTMILGFFEGRMETAPLVAAARHKRRDTPAYWAALARRAEDRSLPRAVALAEAATQRHAGYYYLWLQLGQLRLRAGRFDAAVDAMARARTLAPNQPTVRRSHIRALAAAGRLREAWAASRAAGLGALLPLRDWLAARFGRFGSD